MSKRTGHEATRVKIIALARYCERYMRPLPSRKNIAAAIGIPEKLARQQVVFLQDYGFIEPLSRGLYRVLDDSPLQGAA